MSFKLNIIAALGCVSILGCQLSVDGDFDCYSGFCDLPVQGDSSISAPELSKLLPLSPHCDASIQNCYVAMNVELDGRSVIFDVRATELRAPSLTSQLGAEDIRFYSGESQPGDFIRLTAIAISGGGTYFMGVAKNSEDFYSIDSRSNEDNIAITKVDSQSKVAGGALCGAADLASPTQVRLISNPLNATGAKPSSPQLELEIAIEADFEMYDRWRSQGVSASHAIMGHVHSADAIISSQLGIHLKVAYQRVWAKNNDPYSGTELKDVFREFENSFDSGRYDVELMFTARTIASPLGLARIASACRDDRFNTAIVVETPGHFARTAVVTAHELLHTLGATHLECSDLSLMCERPSTATQISRESRVSVAGYLDRVSCLSSI